MRKTREEWEAFFTCVLKVPRKLAYNAVRDLIAEGWITLDEPREFWIYTFNGRDSIADFYKHRKSSIIEDYGEPTEIIHVREVLDA